MGLDTQPFKRLLKRMASSGSSQSSFGGHVGPSSHCDEGGTSRSASDACSDASTTTPSSWYAHSFWRAIQCCWLPWLLRVAPCNDDAARG